MSMPCHFWPSQVKHDFACRSGLTPDGCCLLFLVTLSFQMNPARLAPLSAGSSSCLFSHRRGSKWDWPWRAPSSLWTRWMAAADANKTFNSFVWKKCQYPLHDWDVTHILGFICICILIGFSIFQCKLGCVNVKSYFCMNWEDSGRRCFAYLCCK